MPLFDYRPNEVRHRSDGTASNCFEFVLLQLPFEGRVADEEFVSLPAAPGQTEIG